MGLLLDYTHHNDKNLFFYRSHYFILKRVGGQWIPANRKQVDGDKFVCLDLILKKDSCLVYSFGINKDWTFEDQMDDIGFSYRLSPQKRWILVQFCTFAISICSHSVHRF